MRFEFRLPDVGEGITEGEIVAWHVQVGDDVVEDQPLVDVMTDKATVTIQSPKTGRVVERHGEVGRSVAVHSILVVLELQASAVAGVEPRPAVPAAHAGAGPRAVAAPAVRKMAREAGIDLAAIPGTGAGGLVTKHDVAAALAAKDSATGSRLPAAATAAPGAPATGASPPPSLALGVARLLGAAPISVPATPGESRIPLRGLRRKIAESMVRAKASAAHFAEMEEVDVEELVAMRNRMNAALADSGTRLGFLPFFVKAVVTALRRHPRLSASIDETTEEIVLLPPRHIGVATATERGLVVPVVRDADRLSLSRIQEEIARLANEARAGTSRLDDLRGGSFTITSLGKDAGILSMPVLRFPEVAILSLDRMEQRPAVVAGEIVVRRRMFVTLAMDHRVVDGDVGSAFLHDLKGLLEHPERLIAEMP